MSSSKDMEQYDIAINSAYGATEEIICQEEFLAHSTDEKYNFNISTMLTLLIQETGRYTERFASDVIISINFMTKALEDPFANNGALFLFGIREDGVDHYEFVRSQMKNNLGNPAYFKQYYRKMYAIHLTVQKFDDSDVHKACITMKEIRGELSHALWSLQSL